MHSQAGAHMVPNWQFQTLFCVFFEDLTSDYLTEVEVCATGEKNEILGLSNHSDKELISCRV